MCIPAISSNVLSQITNVQRSFQQARSQFKQGKQDLQSGNLTQRQTDIVTLSKLEGSEIGGNSALTKALSALGQALQSGNLPAAQQAYSSVPIALVGPCAEPHAHIGVMQNQLQPALNHLGQMLQAGNLDGARQAFSAVQQLWKEIAPAAE